MNDKAKQVINEYKQYIEKNSIYLPKVVKASTITSTYFPIVTCIISNNVSTDECTIDRIEEYEQFYFTVNIYAKNITKGANKIAAQVVIDELETLTDNFFNRLKNMRKTENRPVPNADTQVLRQVMQFQCLIGSARGNIIRR